MKEFFAKRKVHLIFGSALPLVLTLNVIIGFTEGQTLLGAVWKAISEIKPMDYVLLALFWYACAVHPPKDEWASPLISLNLSQTSSEN